MLSTSVEDNCPFPTCLLSPLLPNKSRSLHELPPVLLLKQTQAPRNLRTSKLLASALATTLGEVLRSTKTTTTNLPLPLRTLKQLLPHTLTVASMVAPTLLTFEQPATSPPPPSPTSPILPLPSLPPSILRDRQQLRVAGVVTLPQMMASTLLPVTKASASRKPRTTKSQAA